MGKYYYCEHAGCGKRYQSLGSRDRHIKAKHDPKWHSNALKKPKWVNTYESLLRKEAYHPK